jgi:hypothetical protein
LKDFGLALVGETGLSYGRFQIFTGSTVPVQRPGPISTVEVDENAHLKRSNPFSIAANDARVDDSGGEPRKCAFFLGWAPRCRRVGCFRKFGRGRRRYKMVRSTGITVHGWRDCV